MVTNPVKASAPNSTLSIIKASTCAKIFLAEFSISATFECRLPSIFSTRGLYQVGFIGIAGNLSVTSVSSLSRPLSTILYSTGLRSTPHHVATKNINPLYTADASVATMAPIHPYQCTGLIHLIKNTEYRHIQV